MSPQAVATESKQPKPRARVKASARSKARAETPGVLRPFDRALAASLQRRAQAAEPVAMHPAPKLQALDSLERPRGWMRIPLGWCGSVVASLNARRTAQKPGRLRMVEKVSLGEKQAVAILAVQGVQYLVGQGPGGISLLARLDDPSGDPVAAGAELPAGLGILAAAKQAKLRTPPPRAQTRETR